MRPGGKRTGLAIFLVQLCDLDVVEAPADEGEIRLVEVRRPGELGTGDVGEGMAVEVVEDPVRKEGDEDGEDEVEEDGEESERHLRNSHVVEPTWTTGDGGPVKWDVSREGEGISRFRN